jgi:hypothetical protein
LPVLVTKNVMSFCCACAGMAMPAPIAATETNSPAADIPESFT